jgi:hypothetical protein
MKTVSSLMLAAALALGGCAATVQKTGPLGFSSAPIQVPVASAKRVVLNVQLDPKHPADSGWQAFKKEWVDITQEQAVAQGLKFETQEGQPKPTGEAGVLLVVRVNDYRHVGVGQRLMLGIMTGNAFIDAKVEFRDLSTGASFGERSYNTSSSAGHGVFAAVTPKQIYAIADESLGEIKSAK